jgi:hypothetical protein
MPTRHVFRGNQQNQERDYVALRANGADLEELLLGKGSRLA